MQRWSLLLKLLQKDAALFVFGSRPEGFPLLHCHLSLLQRPCGLTIQVAKKRPIKLFVVIKQVSIGKQAGRMGIVRELFYGRLTIACGNSGGTFAMVHIKRLRAITMVLHHLLAHRDYPPATNLPVGGLLVVKEG